MEEGKGWWWSRGDEEKAKVGADPSVLQRLSSHTTTQPSSIEEEGGGFEGAPRSDLDGDGR